MQFIYSVTKNPSKIKKDENTFFIFLYEFTFNSIMYADYQRIIELKEKMNENSKIYLINPFLDANVAVKSATIIDIFQENMLKEDQEKFNIFSAISQFNKKGFLTKNLEKYKNKVFEFQKKLNEIQEIEKFNLGISSNDSKEKLEELYSNCLYISTMQLTHFLQDDCELNEDFELL